MRVCARWNCVVAPLELLVDAILEVALVQLQLQFARLEVVVVERRNRPAPRGKEYIIWSRASERPPFD